MEENDFIKDLHFCYRPQQREEFMAGTLGLHWAERYPELFDKDDKRLYSTQCRLGYHFYEWLGAILLYESTGYLSLIEKYWAACQPQKGCLFKKIAPPAIYRYVMTDGEGFPDLFCYAPDQKDWHFCEAKGAGDTLSEKQIVRFRRLHEISGKRVCVLWLKELQP